jgi:hypothetical protein
MVLLGIQNIYPSFNNSVIEPIKDPNRIAFRVIFNYATPIERTITVLREDGQWRVDQITPL